MDLAGKALSTSSPPDFSAKPLHQFSKSVYPLVPASHTVWSFQVVAALEELGLEVPPSVGNFVLAGFPDEETADRANAFLLARGVIVRGMKGYGLGRYLRITIGAGWENGMLIDALKDFRGQGG